MTTQKTWAPQQRQMLFRKNYGHIGCAACLQKLAVFFAAPVQAENMLGLEQTDAIL